MERENGLFLMVCILFATLLILSIAIPVIDTKQNCDMYIIAYPDLKFEKTWRSCQLVINDSAISISAYDALFVRNISEMNRGEK